MRRQITLLCFAPETALEALSKEYQVHNCMDPKDRAQFFLTDHANMEIVLTNGTEGIEAFEIERLPDLKLVAAFGAGHENIDARAIRAKGIEVTNGPGTNSKAVADHAMALLLSAARRIVPMNEIVNAGGWSVPGEQWPSVYGKRIGILGLGRIGMEIAKRAAGFDLEIGYHNRSQRSDVDYDYFANMQSLAKWCDYLVCASPGGSGTHHLINDQVLENLGPKGILVNIGRGSIIDTEALVRALETGTIAGAGLDVIEGEPHVPDKIRGLKNLTMSPHVAGRAFEAAQAKLDLFLKNVDLCLSGKPVATPIPED